MEKATKERAEGIVGAMMSVVGLGIAREMSGWIHEWKYM